MESFSGRWHSAGTCCYGEAARSCPSVLIQREDTPGAPDTCRCARAGGVRGRGADALAAEDEDFCLPLVEGQTCCCSSEFEMTFHSRLYNSNDTAQSVDRQELCNAGG